MSELVVELLGGLRVLGADGREVRISSRKAQALLACLALRPGTAFARDRLASLLWDDSDPELGRASLRQALAALRRSLPDAAAKALLGETTSVALDAALASSDVQQFRDLVRDGSPHALAEAAERYPGELLPGFDARSAAFDAWIDEHRRSLRREWVQALQRYAVQSVASTDLEGATLALSRLVAVEPANEAAQRDLMDVYARRGLYTEALRQYRACTEALRRDLDVAPEPATEALYRDILRRRRAADAGAGDPGPAADALPEAAPDRLDAAHGGGIVVSAASITTLKEVVVLATRLGDAHGTAGDDPESVRERWSAAERRVRGIVERLGGVVDRSSQGELASAFGLASPTGNELDRALRAAHELTATADAGAPRFAVGLARGLVLPAGADTPFPLAGQAVATAQSLARAAALDSVVVARDIAAQVADRYALVAGPTGSPEGATVLVPLATPAAERPELQLAGRRAELALLETLFDRVAATRRGRAVIVRGDPGIGKSSLLEALASRVADRAAVHVVQVLDFGQGANERPGPALANRLLAAATGATSGRAAIEDAMRSSLLESDDATAAADLLALEPLGPSAPRLAAMDPATRERARARVLDKLLERATAGRPMLVIVEDAHWADATEIAQLGDLASAVAARPVLLALSTRAEGDPFPAAWRARARGCPVTTLDLAPLAEDEARELAAGYGNVGHEVLERCIETAAGHPLFLVQLLRNAQAGQTALPGSVRALLLARVERLPQEVQQLLHAAATLGARFSVEALRHVAASPIGDPAAVEASGLLACDGGECRFTHALIRAAIYEALLRSTRRSLHLRAAQWFEGRDPTLHAEHLAAAEDPAAAAAHLRAAAIEQRACRFDRALVHAERARLLATSDAERCDAAAGLGDIHLARGRTDEAIEAYRDSAALAAAPGPRARAQLGLATSLRILDRHDEALVALRDAERDAISEGDARRLAQVWTLRGNLHFPRGELEQCLRAHERALELAQQACSPEDIARALGGLGDAQYQRGRMRTALSNVLRCLELSDRHALEGLRLAYLPMAAACRAYCGEFEAAIEGSRRAAADARRAGDVRAELLASSVGASIAIYRGEFGAALECSARSHALARELGARRFEIESTLLQGLAQHGLGRHRESVAALEEAVERARSDAATYCGPWALAALACASGDTTRGRALLEEGEQLLSRGSVSHNHFEFRMLAIEFLLAARDWRAVRRHAAALAAYTREEPLPWSDLVIARAEALAAVGKAARGRANARRLQELVQQAERMGFVALLPGLRAVLDRAG
jgi:DNA-binding SARP family transcriptional activator